MPFFYGGPKYWVKKLLKFIIQKKKKIRLEYGFSVRGGSFLITYAKIILLVYFNQLIVSENVVLVKQFLINKSNKIMIE